MSTTLESRTDGGPDMGAPQGAGHLMVRPASPQANAQAAPNLIELRHGRWWDGFYLLWVIIRFILVAEWAARAREAYVAITGRDADRVARRG